MAKKNFLSCQYKVLVRTEANETLILCSQECKLGKTLWKTVYQYTLKLNISILCDPAFPHSEICTYLLQKTCSVMVALFIIAPNWNQQNCRMGKLWQSHTMEYHCSTKENRVLLHTAWVTHRDNVEPHKPETKEYILYDFIFIKSRSRQT